LIFSGRNKNLSDALGNFKAEKTFLFFQKSSATLRKKGKKGAEREKILIGFFNGIKYNWFRF